MNIEKLICQQYGIDENDINDDTRFKEDLGSDSLDFIEIVSSIENFYDLELPEEKLIEVSTVKHLKNLIIEVLMLISRYSESPNFKMNKYCSFNTKYHYDKNVKDNLEDVFKLCGNIKLNKKYILYDYLVNDDYENPEKYIFNENALMNVDGSLRANLENNIYLDYLLHIYTGIFGFNYDEHSELKLHIQRPGEFLLYHSDLCDSAFYYDDDINSSVEKVRFVIMITDWDFGHVWQHGSASWTHWKSGDIVSWDWRDMPHGTCNVGWTPRLSLIFTGKVTDKVKKFRENHSKDNVFDTPNYE